MALSVASRSSREQDRLHNAASGHCEAHGQNHALMPRPARLGWLAIRCYGGQVRHSLIVRAAHFVLWTAAAFKTDRAQSFHFWPAAALRQAFRSVSVPRTLTGNATRSPSSLAAKLFPLGAGMSGDFALFIHDVAERGFQCCSGSGGEVFL